MTKEFYKSWKRKTKREEAAIKSLKAAKKIILKNIPKKEIIAIYVKGSFPRREMNKKSDVDLYTVVRSIPTLKKIKKLDKKFKTKFKPQINLGGNTFWELKHNKKAKSYKKKGPRATPSRTAQQIKHYKLIYGREIKDQELILGDHIKHLIGMMGVIRRVLLPGYKEKKFGFSEIAKQVFWLTENEQKAKGMNPPHGFKKLAKSIKDKNHIIRDALRFRLKPTKDKRKRAAFIKKLEKYLGELEKLK